AGEGLRGEDGIHIVVRGIGGAGREGAAACVGENTVDHAIGIPERVQRRAVHIGNGWIRPQGGRGVEVRTIRGVVPPWREGRDDVGGVLVDLDRLGIGYLP